MARLEAHVEAAQQYFPTYKLGPDSTEIGVKEYELSAQALNGDQRSLAAATGLLVLSVGVISAMLGANIDQRKIALLMEHYGAHAEVISLSLILVTGLLSVLYFGGLQRSATYAARKIVVLRRLMGIDYGNIDTVLPMDRIEGANEPYAIPMFPGWFAVSTIPALLVSGALSILTFVLALAFQAVPTSGFNSITADLGLSGILGPYAGAIAVPLVTLTAYRRILFEAHEDYRLSAGRLFGRAAPVGVKPRVGHVIYRMQLSVHEAHRLGIQLTPIHRFLVRVEDRQFFRHRGNSVRALASAVWRYFKYKSVSGGSTIEQQLVRSNFLTQLRPAFHRKVLEWILAPWLSSLFSKSVLLDLYLCSARFEQRVIGLPAAISYFFNNHKPNLPLSPAQQFLCVERLSNVTSTFPRARVQALVADLVREGILSPSDVGEINALYARLAREGKIRIKDEKPPGLEG